MRLAAALSLLLGLGVIVYAIVLAPADSPELRVGQAITPFPIYAEGYVPPAPELPELVPTTQPGGALPTGCANWDPAFGFTPEPLEAVGIWSDFQGWHVRLAPGELTSISGTVAGQVVPALANAPLPPEVTVEADAERTTLTFTIEAGSEPVGFDFTADCAQKQFTFEVLGPDGEPLPLDQVQLGQAGRAEAWPVIAQRTPVAGG
jgi:hypothetical protein